MRLPILPMLCMALLTSFLSMGSLCGLADNGLKVCPDNDNSFIAARDQNCLCRANRSDGDNADQDADQDAEPTRYVDSHGVGCASCDSQGSDFGLCHCDDGSFIQVSDSTCSTCLHDETCAGAVCDPDGCNACGLGPCPAGNRCTAQGQCESCPENACGGGCGGCPFGQSCVEGQCAPFVRCCHEKSEFCSTGSDWCIIPTINGVDQFGNPQSGVVVPVVDAFGNFVPDGFGGVLTTVVPVFAGQQCFCGVVNQEFGVSCNQVVIGNICEN